MKDMRHGDARLEIVNEGSGGHCRIEGENVDIIFAWMQLTAEIAQATHVPLPTLLAQCAFLGPEFEKLNQLACDCRIDLSRPTK